MDMKRLIKIEKKIYELLGIKYFKKIVMRFAYLIHYSIGGFYMSREEIKRSMAHPCSNYNMDRGHGLSDLRKFKKFLEGLK